MEIKDCTFKNVSDTLAEAVHSTDNYVRCPNCNAVRPNEKHSVRKLGTVTFVEIDGEIHIHIEKNEGTTARKTKICPNCHTPVTSQEYYWFEGKKHSPK